MREIIFRGKRTDGKGFDSGAVINCCKGRQKTHKGYRWNYVTESDKEE